MILDTLNSGDHYFKTYPGIKQALNFISKAVSSNLIDGKYEIDGNKIYASIDTCTGKGKDKARLESHRKYIDVQFCIEGTDHIGWKSAKTPLTTTEKYNPDKDIEFFSDFPIDWITLSGNTFCILFPHDAHAPLAGTGILRKIVVKISV
ncbi:MAG: YhcH/YjgK/YiaL family protein [Candidatus Omnitrophica bacterium]|nr:YhcH/YjgK/YiaL family protein [Candidatus Omnitrophota bacterium]